MEEPWTPLRVLDWTAGRFRRAGIDSARLDAELLLAHVLGCDRIGLYTQFDKPLREAELARLRALIRRRLAGEPIAYLIGSQEFWSLSFAVDARVLIPRRDSEAVIEAVLDAVRDRAAPMRVADVATGSGALAVTLARELSQAEVVATDLSAAALEVAAKNARANGVADRVEFLRGDLLAPLSGRPPFDVLVANLPYVPAAEIDRLSAEVRREPREALDGGADGLALVRRLVPGLAQVAAPGGVVALEHGFDQADAVAALLDETGAFEPAGTRADLAGHPRVTTARRRG